MKGWIRTAFGICTGVCAASAITAQEIDLPNDTALDRSALVARTGVVVALQEPVEIAGRHFSAPDTSLGRPVFQIFLSANELLRSSQADANSSAVLAPPILELNLGDRTLTMAVVERTYDRQFDAYHLTLVSIDNDDRSYLSVSGTDSAIVGTFIVGGNEYRVISLNRESQFVYPVEAGFTGFDRTTLPDMTNRTGRLEARHLQLGYLARIGARNVYTGLDGKLTVVSDIAIGDIDMVRARRNDPSDDRVQFDEETLTTEIEQFLDDHRVLTLFEEHVELEIQYIRPFSGGIEVHARQIIDGIPVDVPFRVTISEEGKVQRIMGGLSEQPSIESAQRTRLTFEQAFDKALGQLATDFGITENTEAGQRELVYVPDSPDNSLTPYWAFTLNSHKDSYLARVNAITGEADVRRDGIE